MFGLFSGLMVLSAVTITTRDLRVGDLLPARAARIDRATAELVVLRLPAGTTRLVLPAPTVASLLRRRVPGLAVPTGAGDVVIIANIAAAPAPAARCAMTSRPLRAGAVLVSEDVASVPCRAGGGAVLTYDRGARSAVAMRDLAAGQYLGRVSLSSDRRVAKGAVLSLRSGQGPVVVERAVTTLQASRSGTRVFVRDAAGSVLSAPLVLEAER